MDHKAVIIATGPSLTVEDAHEAALCRDVIAVNDAYKVAPYGAVLYACDLEWWVYHIDREDEPLPEFFDCWTVNDEAAKRYGLNHIPGVNGLSNGNHFDTSGERITTGHNSGFQALNLAYKLGYRDVVLLGFDCGEEPGGKSHFFGDHPHPLKKQSPYHSFKKAFDKAAPLIAEAGMKVVNASRKTRLECFPRATLSEAL